MKIFKKEIVFLASLSVVFLLQTNRSFAEDPPKYVYRIDIKDYDNIFENGFQAYGENTNLARHVEGLWDDSAFIATTRNQDVLTDKWFEAIIDGARREGRQPRTQFIYKIRADNNFYGVDRTARAQPEYPNYPSVLQEIFARQEEWAALRQIPTTMIMQVQEYRYAPTQERFILVRTIPNPHYPSNPPDTAGNPDPFDHFVVGDEYLRLLGGADIYNDGLSSDFCSILRRGTPHKIKTHKIKLFPTVKESWPQEEYGSCAHPQKYVWLDSRYHRVFDVNEQINFLSNSKEMQLSGLNTVSRPYLVKDIYINTPNKTNRLHIRLYERLYTRFSLSRNWIHYQLGVVLLGANKGKYYTTLDKASFVVTKSHTTNGSGWAGSGSYKLVYSHMETIDGYQAKVYEVDEDQHPDLLGRYTAQAWSSLYVTGYVNLSRLFAKKLCNWLCEPF